MRRNVDQYVDPSPQGNTICFHKRSGKERILVVVGLGALCCTVLSTMRRPDLVEWLIEKFLAHVVVAKPLPGQQELVPVN